jgi:hypothetical protein
MATKINVVPNIKCYHNVSRHLLETNSRSATQENTFYGVRRFITAFTKARQYSQSSARLIQFRPFHNIPFKLHFNINFPSMPRSFKWFFPSNRVRWLKGQRFWLILGTYPVRISAGIPTILRFTEVFFSIIKQYRNNMSNVTMTASLQIISKQFFTILLLFDFILSEQLTVNKPQKIELFIISDHNFVGISHVFHALSSSFI